MTVVLSIDAVELRVCYTCCRFSHLAKNYNKDTNCSKYGDDHGVSDGRISNKKEFNCIKSLSHKLITVVFLVLPANISQYMIRMYVD